MPQAGNPAVAALGKDVHYSHGLVATRVGVAFVVFCMAASCIYLINDARDIEADRAHPTKRFRPIAAGVVPVPLAYGLAAVLGVAALVIAWFVTPNLAIVIAVYLAMQLAYCFGLKHQAVLDICIVSSAYLIRAIPSTTPQAEATENLVNHLRDTVIPPIAKSTGLTVYVSGFVAALDPASGEASTFATVPGNPVGLCAADDGTVYVLLRDGIVRLARG